MRSSVHSFVLMPITMAKGPDSGENRCVDNVYLENRKSYEAPEVQVRLVTSWSQH